MGIIEKQATKNVFYSYLGAGLGFITVMCFSHLLSPSENGVIRILLSYAALFSQFANLGFTTATIRFFPYFRDKEKGHNGFLFYGLAISFIGFILCLLVFLLIKPYLIETNQEKSQLFVDFIFFLMPLTFFTIFFNILDSYLRAGFNSVIGSVTKEIFQRIFILSALGFYFLHWIDFTTFLFLYIFFTCLPTLILVAFIIKKGEWHVKPKFGFLEKGLKDEMVRISIYSILTGGAGAIIVNIDSIMLNQMLGEAKTGIYGIAFYFGSILLIPARAIYRITSSIVAEKFKIAKIEDIHKLYNQSCNTQLTIGTLLFIGIWSNIDNIMQLLPEEYANGKYVILIISAGYLAEMATGINQVIIANSKYYRYDAFIVFILVVLTVLTNYILIPLYGITGSAIATAITVMFGNGLRYFLLYNKFKMQPYDANTWKILLISVISFIPGYLLPFMNNLFLDIILRSIIVGGLFLLLMFKLDASPDLNNKIRKNLLRFR
jgi:O-antigen/teichoic acid export membrane protein